jgi:hypothetical protein
MSKPRPRPLLHASLKLPADAQVKINAQTLHHIQLDL